MDLSGERRGRDSTLQSLRRRPPLPPPSPKAIPNSMERRRGRRRKADFPPVALLASVATERDREGMSVSKLWGGGLLSLSLSLSLSIGAEFLG